MAEPPGEEPPVKIDRLGECSSLESVRKKTNSNSKFEYGLCVRHETVLNLGVRLLCAFLHGREGQVWVGEHARGGEADLWQALRGAVLLHDGPGAVRRGDGRPRAR